MNSGGADIEAKATLTNNFVGAAPKPDMAYVCFGDCTLLEGSENNTYCGGKPNAKFNNPQFTQASDCDLDSKFESIRDDYPASEMPICPQWTNFTMAEGYSCSGGTVGGGANWSG